MNNNRFLYTAGFFFISAPSSTTFSNDEAQTLNSSIRFVKTNIPSWALFFLISMYINLRVFFFQTMLKKQLDLMGVDTNFEQDKFKIDSSVLAKLNNIHNLSN